MFEIFGISSQLLFSQLLLGLINGAFYAMLSLGLAVIFGMLNVINFAHGALYMLGAFVAWLMLTQLGIGYFPALLLAPLAAAYDAAVAAKRRQLVVGVRSIEAAMRRVDKTKQAEGLSREREIFMGKWKRKAAEVSA